MNLLKPNSPSKIFSLIAEHHPGYHINTGTPNLIKTFCSYPRHLFSCVVATDNVGPSPVPGPWDDIPTLSLFRPRSLLPDHQIGLGLLDPYAFRMQQGRAVRFMQKHGAQRQFVLIANNVRLAAFAAGLSHSMPRDIYIVDDFVADSHLYRVSSQKAQKVLDKLIHESDRVFTISPVYAADLEEKYGRRCEFLPIPVSDKLFDIGKARNENSRRELKGDRPIIIHHAGQIHHLYADALAELVSLLKEIAENRNREIHLELWGNLEKVQVEKALKLDLNQYNDEGKSFLKIKLCGQVALKELTDAQQRADFLLLVNSFLPELKKQIRCSFSSKISEYMLSGVPIIVYAPDYSSLVAHLGKHKAAHIVSDRDSKSAVDQIGKIMDDPDKHRTVEAARVLAMTEHSSYAFFKRIAGNVIASNDNN